jgi:hypothetical protein
VQALKRWTFVLGIAFLLAGCSSQNLDFDISITGAVDRDFSGAEIFYEGSPGGRQIFVQKTGPGEDIQVLVVGMPVDVAPGAYEIATSGQMNASYYDFVDGVSNRFDRDVRGSINIRQAEGGFSGEIEFYAYAPFSQDTIQVVGNFNNIPYSSEGKSASSGTIFSAALVFGLIVLVLANFFIQFYVGSKVYATEGMGVLRALRGTRTFMRGWQIPELRKVMVIWSAILVLLLFLLLLVGVVATS